VSGSKVFFGGKDGHVYALNLADGRQLWKSESMRTLTAPPLAGEAVVCMQTFYGSTVAFDANTGERLWRANLGGSLQSTPILTGDTVYLATYSGVIYAWR
jgi:eukaryotic-like serine/threonine-protein kinase